jgi:hypothetical protein
MRFGELIARLGDAGLTPPTSTSEARSLVPWAVEFRYDDILDEQLVRTAACKTVTQVRAWVDDHSHVGVARYDRRAPTPDLKALRYLRSKSTTRKPIKLTPTGNVVYQAFHGPASIRMLVQGGSKLDVLLNVKKAGTTK